jgi:hypothetical protein
MIIAETMAITNRIFHGKGFDRIRSDQIKSGGMAKVAEGG